MMKSPLIYSSIQEMKDDWLCQSKKSIWIWLKISKEDYRMWLESIDNVLGNIKDTTWS